MLPQILIPAATVLIVLSLTIGRLFALAAPSRTVACLNSPHHPLTNSACCKWLDVLDDIQENLFDGGECDTEAHESLRIMFHDAIGYSKSVLHQGKYGGGGADGSLMSHSDTELNYKANTGLDEIVNLQRPFALKHGVSFGDFIQFAGAVGVSNCIGGPRLQFMAGRPNISLPAPDNLIPAPFHSPDQIFDRMRDAGFTPNEVVDLLVSHTVAAQHTTDPTINNAPLDSTPNQFDAQFFVETLLKGVEYPGNGSHYGEKISPLPGELRLQSDWAIARDPRTACEWQSFLTNHDLMTTKFERVMAKVSILGQEHHALTDCSEVVPVPPPARRRSATLPAGKTRNDIEAACAATPFPSLRTDPGPATAVKPVEPAPKQLPK